MRPRFSRALAAVAALLAISGCARVDLVNEWPSIAEPTGWEPKAGICSYSFAETTHRSAYAPQDCAKTHTYETVYIGQFKGDAAALPKPPARGSAAMVGAWAECDTKTTEYLGAPWRDGRITIGVSVPSAGNWEGGARWFRCDAAVTTTLFGASTTHSKSLKGELAQASPLRLGCFTIPEGDDVGWPEIACTDSHNGEYVGTYIATDTWAVVDADSYEDVAHRKCLGVIAAYVGVPNDRNMQYRSGTGFWYPSEDEWNAGDHAVRCFLYLDDRKVSRSLKGGGAKALPTS
jgi:Septum formation